MCVFVCVRVRVYGARVHVPIRFRVQPTQYALVHSALPFGQGKYKSTLGTPPKNAFADIALAWFGVICSCSFSFRFRFVFVSFAFVSY